MLYPAELRAHGVIIMVSLCGSRFFFGRGGLGFEVLRFFQGFGFFDDVVVDFAPFGGDEGAAGRDDRVDEGIKREEEDIKG